MAEELNVDNLVEEIADRVRRRMDALRAGTEQPCTASSPEKSAKAGKTEECAPACDGCGNFNTCNTVTLVKAGAARLTADQVRTSADIAPYIDHTLLKPEATREDVARVAREAVEHGFATVCVNSSHVATVAGILAGSRSVPIAVVGFPLGAALTSAKAFEAREAIQAGAREIDMVIHVGALKARDYALVLSDIAQVVEASRPWPVKVILETSLSPLGRG
jgi:deoxyribose-phosphate aldolase